MPDSLQKEMKLQKEHRQVGSYYRILPAIRLAGNLLEECGFYAGEKVIVTYQQEKVIITTKRPVTEYLAEREAERKLRQAYEDSREKEVY